MRASLKDYDFENLPRLKSETAKGNKMGMSDECGSADFDH